MSDTFIRIVQDIKNNVTGTVLGAKIGQVAGNLVEVKIFSLAADAESRMSAWNRLTKPVAKNPYKLLEPYTIRDSKIFYGRDKVIGEILSKLFREDKRLLVIFGAPGVGKTSLIDAGVAPLIIQQGGLLVSITNYDNPAESIRQALRGLTTAAHEELAGAEPTKEDVKVKEDAKPAEVIDDEKSALRKLIESKLDPSSLILVLDQFELLFERRVTHKRRREFFTDLKELFAAFPQHPPKVIIVARNDDEVKSSLADFQDQLPDLFDARVEVPLLEDGEARKAIMAPLSDTGDRVQFESDDLVKEIAENLASLGNDKKGVYPLRLQIVCSALYEEVANKSPYTITTALFKGKKFSEGILASFLEVRLDNQLSNFRSEALELLVQLAADGQDRWVSPGKLSLNPDRAKPEKVSVEAALERMVAAKLLYRQSVNDELRYGFIDAGMAERVKSFAPEEVRARQRPKDEMKRMWQAWLARDVYATREQLDYISQNLSSVELEPVQVLYLMRSAIEQDADTGDWLKIFIAKNGKALISALENDQELKHSPGSSMATVEFAWKLLTAPQTSTNGSGNGSPPHRFKTIAESAADGPDDFSRATSALALMSKGVGAAVGDIDEAIGKVKSRSERMKRVKLRSAMVEADLNVKESNSSLKFRERSLLFLWLVFKRAYYRDAARILRITAGGALCSGVLVGIWGGLLYKVMIGSGAAIFSVRFTNGFLLGGTLAFGLSLIRSLIQVHGLTDQFTGSPARAAFLMCTVIFGSLHWALNFIIGSGFLAWDGLFLMGMGFFFGTGIGLGVMNDFDQQGSIEVKWDWRYILAAAIVFLLVPVIFLIGEIGVEPLNLTIVSKGRDFASNLASGLGIVIDKVFVHGETDVRLPKSGAPFAFHVVAAVDNIMTGLLLIFGFKLGVRLSKVLGSQLPPNRKGST